MTVRDDGGQPTAEGSDNRATPEETFRNAMLLAVGFGVAAALTGLLTMGLIEFAQSIGWWAVTTPQAPEGAGEWLGRERMPVAFARR